MLIKLSDLLGKFKNTLLCTMKEFIHTIFTFLINKDPRLLFFQDFADLFESEEQLIKEDPRLLGFFTICTLITFNPCSSFIR